MPCDAWCNKSNECGFVGEDYQENPGFDETADICDYYYYRLWENRTAHMTTKPATPKYSSCTGKKNTCLVKFFCFPLPAPFVLDSQHQMIL